MAKPRIFISSTCYDLSEVRNQLCRHLEDLGMEAVASDDPAFGVTPGVHSHHACLDEVDRADYLVLIVGGRRGGTFVGTEKSITNEEYSRAAARRIPILSFVKADVVTAKRMHSKNPGMDCSEFVDDVRIFDFVDVVASAAESNWLWQFVKGSEICEILTAQFAHIVKLYAERVLADKTPTIASQPDPRGVVEFPGRLTQLPSDYQEDDRQEAWITTGLRIVHASISAIVGSLASGKDEKLKTLWLLGRYGAVSSTGSIVMNNNRFKQFAWSTSKGRRVLDQLASFGVQGEYEVHEAGFDGLPVELISLRFAEDRRVATAAGAAALKLFVETLVQRYGEQAGILMFQRCDMTVFS